MGKRKNTAKTGDKKVYASRETGVGTKKTITNEDSLESFHKQRDDEFLRLGEAEEGPGKGDAIDESFLQKQHVLDLGITDESSGDDNDLDDGDESSQEDFHNEVSNVSDPTSSSSDEDDYDDDDDDEIEKMKEDPRRWGKKKASYYDGDTGDLEIGQDEEDAYAEETAAKEIQSSRFDDMADDDFELSDGDSDDGCTTTEADREQTTMRDISNLTRKDQHKLLKKQHPEVFPIASYFGGLTKELKNSTLVATAALLGSKQAIQSVGATREGQQYLITKSLIEHSVALNTTLYLLIKSSMGEVAERTHNIGTHPVMLQLKQINAALEKLGDSTGERFDDVQDEIKNLVQAAGLMKDSNFMALADRHEHDGKNMSESEDGTREDRGDREKLKEADEQREVPRVDSTTDYKFGPTSNRQDNTAEAARSIFEEARFGLRRHEIAARGETKTRRVARTVEFGDLDQEDDAPLSFASTINAIEQRSKKRSRQRPEASLVEQLDDPDEAGGRIVEGLRMMEEELGMLSSKDGDCSPGGEIDESFDHDMDELEFYNTISKQRKTRKDLKQKLYQVAPKFPSAEVEVDGERAISRSILKNRGLVAHKSKLNRNPRVKKREQYRKALIRRKGAVRELRTNESQKYEGEETGIKSRISRSRKLVS